MILRGTCRCENPQAYKRKVKKIDTWFCVLCAGSVPVSRVAVKLQDFHPIDYLDRINKPRFHKINSDHVLVEWDFHVSLTTTDLAIDF